MSLTPTRSTRRNRRDRRGAAVVEFAIIAPILFLLIFGIVEFGRLFMVQQVLTNASREGARRAMLESSTTPEVKTVVSDYLTGASVSGATVTVSPATMTSLGLGDPVTVSVSIPFEDVSWLPTPWFLGGRELTAQSVMRAERPE